MKKVFRIIIIFIINNFLSFTRFFKIKRIMLNFVGVNVGYNTKIVGPIYLGNKINVKIGENCWVGKNVQLDGDGEVIIGNNVDIAPNVVINTGGHKISSINRRAGEGVVNRIFIEDGVWIGTRSTIINNIKVGYGSVIAAGSVVIKDINENVLVAGNPAVIKRKLEELI